MNIKNLNEKLNKVLNEISDKAVEKVGEKRQDNLGTARTKYSSGEGSLDTLVTAGKKYDNFKDLKAKRTARKDNNAKHVIIDADLLPKIREGRYTLGYNDYAAITDEELIKLANQEYWTSSRDKVIPSLEEAKKFFTSHDDKIYEIYIFKSDLLRNNKIVPSKTEHSFIVLVDTNVDDAINEINGKGAKAKKQLDKYAKLGKNLIKYIKKGEIENFEYDGSQDGNRKFQYSIAFKNPGFPDEETMREFTEDWKEQIHNNRWEIPKPEPRVEGSKLWLYSNCVEHNAWLIFGDDGYLVVSGIAGYEEVDD